MISKLLRLAEHLLAGTMRLASGILEVLARWVAAVWGWLILHLAAWTAMFLISLRSFFLRLRMSHDNGMAARGEIRLAEDAQFPENDFFKPGRVFPCRARLAMVSFSDDARFVARGVSLKFADARKKSPLDLLLNTGLTTPFNNVRTFWKFMILTAQGRAQNAIRYMQEDSALYVGCLDPLRRNPESFAQLYYHSKMPYVFELADGSKSYVKFRLTPWDMGPESGLPDEDDQLDWAWCWQGIRPGERRSRNYLKQELRARLEEGPVRLRLQMQLHPVREEERQDDVIDSALVWDEEDHPWLEVGEVRLDEVLDHRESNLSLFTIRHRPKCLSILKPRDIDDPAGMNYLRSLAVWPRRARLLGNMFFGIPAPFPDEREPGKTTHFTPFREPLPIGDPIPLELPQHESSTEQAARRQELGLRRGAYRLEVPGTLPSYVAELPPEEEFDRSEKSRMYADIASTLSDLGLGDIRSIDRKDRTLATFDRYYPFRKLPAVHSRWRLDAEFARQRLVGVNPTLIERCRALPPNFPVNEWDVAGLLPEGTTLEAQIEAGRVYMTDYRILEGLKTGDVRYQVAPICLFHVEEDGTLLPLAIQLGQSPAAGPIFTPKDPPWLWLTVKTYAQSADSAYHELYAHLLRTHMVSEAVWLCARRNLSDRHPLIELLRPHFRDTMAVNHAARTQMLIPGGPLPETMALGYDGSIELLERAFGEYRFDRFELDRDLEVRGVAERGPDGEYLLPDYHYRDDALAIQRAIQEHVLGIVGLFYASDEDVRGDYELRAWLEELGDPARGNLPGLPNDGHLETRADLCRFLTQVIFVATAEHSAVNNGQYDYFGYVPNVPGALSKPPPRTKDELSEAWLVEALPDAYHCGVQIAMVHLLSIPADWPIGNVPEGNFGGHADAIELLKRFHARLDRVSLAIRSRNALLEVPYPFLDPRHVSQSTLI